eukprot:768520-Hanusia_phi.AAC.13
MSDEPSLEATERTESTTLSNVRSKKQGSERAGGNLQDHHSSHLSLLSQNNHRQHDHVCKRKQASREHEGIGGKATREWSRIGWNGIREEADREEERMMGRGEGGRRAENNE